MSESIALAVGDLVLADAAVAASESPRPFLHPLRDARQCDITDHRPGDHAWHHGLSLAVPVVHHGDRLTTFWGGPTYVDGRGYVDLDNAGQQHVVTAGADADGAEIALEWRDETGAPLLRELRSIRSTAVDDNTWVLHITSQWRAALSLRFGSPTTEGRPGAGYGGLFLRAHPRFTGAGVLLAGEQHVRRDDEVMGASAAWCGLVAEGEGTIVMVADDGPVADGPWFVRSDPVPMLCAAPFFFDEFALAAGGAATWRWRLISSTEALDADRVDRLVRRTA